jgi:hypothetical protein
MKNKSKVSVLKAMQSAAVAACLLAGGIATAGELGFGFEPGLVAGKDFVAGQLIVELQGGRSHPGRGRTAQMAGGGRRYHLGARAQSC